MRLLWSLCILKEGNKGFKLKNERNKEGERKGREGGRKEWEREKRREKENWSFEGQIGHLKLFRLLLTRTFLVKSPVVKTPRSQYRGHRFNPWSGSYDPTCHVVQHTHKKTTFQTFSFQNKITSKSNVLKYHLKACRKQENYNSRNPLIVFFHYQSCGLQVCLCIGGGGKEGFPFSVCESIPTQVPQSPR